MKKLINYIKKLFTERRSLLVCDYIIIKNKYLTNKHLKEMSEFLNQLWLLRQDKGNNKP